MSFQLRSVSARRYRVEGDLPSPHAADFVRRLSDRRFRPLSANEEKTHGWVTADNCLDSHFSAEALARGPAAAFALRVDRRRVNGRILRAMLDLEFRGRAKDAEAAAEGASSTDEGKSPRRKRVGREEKAEIRRALTQELLKNTSPSLEVHPVLVYPKERLVLFLSLSRPANEVFRALFCDTFDVTLSALTPFHRGIELLEHRGAAEALAAVSRTEFAPPPAAVPASRKNLENRVFGPLGPVGPVGPLGALETLR